jgi:GTP1/Obg family GTP-binding protein
MKRNRLEKYESKVRSEPSPEQIQQAREWAVNRMMEVVDKLPANIQPVKESLQELARQAKEGIPREITQIISGSDIPPNATKLFSSAPVVTETDSGKVKFTDFELELLRTIDAK